MLQTIIEASKNFCAHQLREEATLEDKTPTERTLIAYIDIETTSGQKYRTYTASTSCFMQKISKIFLDEEESDEETLVDMSLETANMIIGNAKVIAEERNDNPFIISTPFFEKHDAFDLTYDEIQTLKINNCSLTVAIKELD